MTHDKKNRYSEMGSQAENAIALSRRRVLKAAFAGIAAGLAVPVLPRLSACAAEASGN